MIARRQVTGLFLAAGLLALSLLAAPAPSAAALDGPFPFPGNQRRAAPDLSPGQIQIEALSAMEATAPDGVRVRWDGETGSLGAISGRLSPPFIGSGAEAARHFLSEQSGLIIPDVLPAGAFTDPRRSPLRVFRVTPRRSMEHVMVLQYHGDLRVHRGGYTVSFRLRPGPGGVVVRDAVSAMGRYFPGISASFDVTPKVTRDEALAAASDAVAPGAALTEPPAHTLLIYPLAGSYRLAWQVEFRTAEPLGRWRVHVDAHSGEILEAQNRIMHGNVSGDVWPMNPIRSPALANFPFRDAYVTRNSATVTTDALGDYDDAGAATVDTVLSGPFVDVINEDVAEATYSGPPGVVWSYPVSDTHFDEINVFYHINIFHAHVKNNLGFAGADIQLPAVVHYGTAFGNAFYDGTMIAFGDGDGIWTDNFAQDDVIYHEYGHFLFDRAISMGYGWNEVGAMQEGGADYFACSFGNDSVNGESIDLVGGLARDLDNKGFFPLRIYPEYLITWGFEPHYGGEVWGGVLWDIRKVHGAAVTDVIAFEGLFFLPPSPLFIDGREGIVQADLQLFNGIHTFDIEQLMFERGIGPEPSTDPFVKIIADPPIGVAPLPVLFTGIAVDNGSIQDYYWDLGDGTVIPFGSSTLTHTYTAPGTYTVTLIATDDTGATGSDTIQVPVSLPGEILVPPEELDIGFVRSDEPTANFFGDDDVFAGYLTGLDYHGAGLFRVPVIPGGTSNVIFDSVTVEFTGQDDLAKAPAGGTWSLKLLAEEMDVDWQTKGYLDIVNAPVVFTLEQPLSNGDLVSGAVNTFSVSSTQLPALHNRVASGSLSFRLDGPFGVNNLFSWDSGFDRFDEDPAATRVKPLLRISYTQSRMTGDINADGIVDGTDARLAAEAAVGLRSLSPGDMEAGDVDRNGILDERDAAAILAKAAGVINF